VKVHPTTIGRRLQSWSGPGSALPSPPAR
jgi:hypothetical protein